MARTTSLPIGNTQGSTNRWRDSSTPSRDSPIETLVSRQVSSPRTSAWACKLSMGEALRIRPWRNQFLGELFRFAWALTGHDSGLVVTSLEVILTSRNDFQ